MTEVGKPVPVEGRLTADNGVRFGERVRLFETGKFLGVEIPAQMFLSLVIDDANVHGVGV